MYLNHSALINHTKKNISSTLDWIEECFIHPNQFITLGFVISYILMTCAIVSLIQCTRKVKRNRIGDKQCLESMIQTINSK